ncbi:calcium-binding protein, partial [Paralimibaculum aggregatum]|uniref:calcium-binding protein n=1 Tax=Paralimibaculum aggregatum TaxID=3036245 RepID=UPI003DA0238E
FYDALIIEEGQSDEGSNAMDTERAGFAAGAYFLFSVTGAAEDGSVNGLLAVDEDTAATGEDNGVFDEVDHTATVLNMEVVRTLSDTENDTLSFAGVAVDEDGVTYDNSMGLGETDFTETDGDESYSQLQGFENIIGSSEGDVLLGGSQDEDLDGGAGDDYIDGGDGADTIDGGSGDDYLYGSCGEDSIDGGDGCDTLIGGDDD